VPADETGPVFTLATGPVGSTPATLAALAQPIVHHTDPAFRAGYAETVRLLREAFGTDDDPVIFPGEAVTGLEASAKALIAPDDVVLNVVTGIYGQAFGRQARALAKEVIEIEAGWDVSVDPAAVAEAFRKRPDIAIVSVVHCETPSGTVNDVGAIAGIAARHGALLIVDAVSSFGGIRTDFGSWPGISITAPQKALGGTPGLSLLHVSDAAWRHIDANPRAPRGSALSISDWRDAHRPGGGFPFTPNVSEIYALQAVLRQLLDEGLETAINRHKRVAHAVRQGAVALGLSLWPAPEAVKADTITVTRVPDGVDEAAVRAVARNVYGVMLAGGLGPMGGQVFRIGHMGPAAYPLSPVIALTALGQALRTHGVRADVGAAAEAAVAAYEEYGDTEDGGDQQEKASRRE
jgi:pyridoxamine--pyruvate transaminase